MLGFMFMFICNFTMLWRPLPAPSLLPLRINDGWDQCSRPGTQTYPTFRSPHRSTSATSCRKGWCSILHPRAWPGNQNVINLTAWLDLLKLPSPHNHRPFASRGPGLSMLTSTKQFEQFVRDTIQMCCKSEACRPSTNNHGIPWNTMEYHGHSTGMPCLRLPAKEFGEAPPSAPGRVVAPWQSLTAWLRVRQSFTYFTYLYGFVWK